MYSYLTDQPTVIEFLSSLNRGGYASHPAQTFGGEWCKRYSPRAIAYIFGQMQLAYMTVADKHYSKIDDFRERAKAFWAELHELEQKHRITIRHEDAQGAFELYDTDAGLAVVPEDYGDEWEVWPL